ncbi:MAG: glycosyltransferase family 2 protein [Verrucomicrobiales bacterium]|nr:glycosyltransferase family 2 protein [Verrucomicrobiales bacterium]
MRPPFPISAIIPAHRRFDTVSKAIEVITACQPGPSEILVHVDGGDSGLLQQLALHHPNVRVLHSHPLLGPGGSRNALVEAASHEWIANFDEDSFPAHSNYFARLQALIARFPDAAMFSAASNAEEMAEIEIQEIAIPSGCGCVFRKSWFAKTGGFVPLPIAYSMEEVDIGLRVHAKGGAIILDPQLQVIHDKKLPDRIDPEINAAIMANTALFPYLRFPVLLWPMGLLNIISRMIHLIRRGWTTGLLEGLQRIPTHLIQFRTYRSPVPFRAVFSWQMLRRYPRNLMTAAHLGSGSQESQ